MIYGVTPSGQGLADTFDIAGAKSPASPDAGLSFNAADYLPMLAEYDLTDEQAREWLAAIWSIMRSYVELGLAVDVCGQLGLDALPVLSSATRSISSNDPTNQD